MAYLNGYVCYKTKLMGPNWAEIWNGAVIAHENVEGLRRIELKMMRNK